MIKTLRKNMGRFTFETHFTYEKLDSHKHQYPNYFRPNCVMRLAMLENVENIENSFW